MNAHQTMKHSFFSPLNDIKFLSIGLFISIILGLGATLIDIASVQSVRQTVFVWITGAQK